MFFSYSNKPFLAFVFVLFFCMTIDQNTLIDFKKVWTITYHLQIIEKGKKYLDILGLL